DYRAYLKSICQNPLVVSFWDRQAEQVSGEASLKNMAPYITSKLNQFTHNPLLRPIIGQRHSSINFRQIMDDKQILLVNLSKGLLGEFDTQLLGMILIGKLFIAAMGRADINKAQRTPFHWYIDEFQNFATDSIGHLLSESRKYGLRLSLANQNLTQLHLGNGSKDLREAVLGNVANLLFFRMGVTDAQQLSAYTQPELSSQDLQFLPDFHAVARLLNHNAPMRPVVLKTLPKQERLLDEEVKDEILAYCRDRYMRPIEEVEQEIFEWAQKPHWEQEKQSAIQEELQQMEKRLTQLEQECPVQNTKPIANMSKEELQALRIDSVDYFTARVKRKLTEMGIDTVGQLCDCTESRLR
ncbi:MAG: TraM recognition domain-containing protein, partial [Nitrospira sp.]